MHDAMDGSVEDTLFTRHRPTKPKTETKTDGGASLQGNDLAKWMADKHKV
jgi:hypothetical protein